MTDDGFTAPHRGDNFEPSNHPGELMLYYPTEWHDAIPTKFDKPGEKSPSAVSTHIVFLDGPSEGTVLHDAMVFGRFMVGQLKGGVGAKAVLGRLGQGQNTKGNPPWVIMDPTEDDILVARKWTAVNPDPRSAEVQSPGPVSPPPTTPASGSSATGGWDNLPTPTAPAPTAPTAPNGNGASKANPNDIVKCVTAGVDITGKSAEQIALIAAALG